MKALRLSLATMLLAAAAAWSAPIALNTTLSPSPGTGSTGSGTFNGTFDPATNVLAFTLTWTGLTTNLTNSHIHLAPTPGGNGPVLVPFFAPGTIETITPTPPVLPLGTSGSLTESIQITDAATLNSFFSGSAAGLLYVNVHTTQNPASEIRGDLPATFLGTPPGSPVPEPGTMLLMAAGLAVLWWGRRFRLPVFERSSPRSVRLR
jgi:hypothetical protein